MSISEQTFFPRKKKLAEMGVTELHKLKQLEEENRKLKKLVADLSLDKRIMQDIRQKFLRPDLCRAFVKQLKARYSVSSLELT